MGISFCKNKILCYNSLIYYLYVGGFRLAKRVATKAKPKTKRVAKGKKGAAQGGRVASAPPFDKLKDVETFPEFLDFISGTRMLDVANFYSLKRKYLGYYKASLVHLYDLGYSSEVNVLSERDLLASYAHEGIHFTFKGGKVPLASWVFYLESLLSGEGNEFYTLMAQMLHFREVCQQLDSLYDSLRLYRSSLTGRRGLKLYPHYASKVGFTLMDERLSSAFSGDVYRLLLKEGEELVALPITSPYAYRLRVIASELGSSGGNLPDLKDMELFKVSGLGSLSLADVQPVLEEILKSDIVFTGEFGKQLEDFLSGLIPESVSGSPYHNIEAEDVAFDEYGVLIPRVDASFDASKVIPSQSSLRSSLLDRVMPRDDTNPYSLTDYFKEVYKEFKGYICEYLSGTLSLNYSSIKPVFMGIDNTNLYFSLPKVDVGTTNVRGGRKPYMELVSVGTHVLDYETGRALPKVNQLLGLTGDFISVGSPLFESGTYHYVGCPVALVDSEGDTVLYVDTEQVLELGTDSNNPLVSKVTELGDRGINFKPINSTTLLEEGSLTNFYVNSYRLSEEGTLLRPLYGVYSAKELLRSILGAEKVLR